MIVFKSERDHPYSELQVECFQSHCIISMTNSDPSYECDFPEHTVELNRKSLKQLIEELQEIQAEMDADPCVLIHVEKFKSVTENYSLEMVGIFIDAIAHKSAGTLPENLNYLSVWTVMGGKSEPELFKKVWEIIRPDFEKFTAEMIF